MSSCRRESGWRRLLAFWRRPPKTYDYGEWQEPPPDIGVREPRRPRPSSGAGSIALEPPP
jgi:hypothetical protein